MSLPALLLRVVLACCLVWAQHAALAHALEHLDDGGHHPPAHHETGAVCDLCLSHVPLGAGVAPGSTGTMRVTAGPPPAPVPAVLPRCGDAGRHAYRSRAPPALLR